MATKSWVLDLDDGSHTVELDHGPFSGKRTIRVDGRVVHESTNFLDFGSKHSFEVGGADLQCPDSVGWVWLPVRTSQERRRADLRENGPRAAFVGYLAARRRLDNCVGGPHRHGLAHPNLASQDAQQGLGDGELD